MPTSPATPEPGSPAPAGPLGERPPGGRSPRELRVAVAIVLAQALVLLGFGIYTAVATFESQPLTRANALAVAVITLAVAALAAWLAWKLYRLRRWARTPVIMLQLLWLPVAVTLLQAGRTLPGVLVLLPAGWVLLLLFSPPVRLLLEHWRED